MNTHDCPPSVQFRHVYLRHIINNNELVLDVKILPALKIVVPTHIMKYDKVKQFEFIIIWKNEGDERNEQLLKQANLSENDTVVFKREGQKGYFKLVQPCFECYRRFLQEGKDFQELALTYYL